MQTTMPMDEVIAALGSTGLQYEVERDWVWITTDLAPLHYKCSCAPCESRKEQRGYIRAIGFIYKDGDHPLPSGATARWAHHCEKPIRFRRKGQKGKEESSKVSDAELLAALCG